MRARQAALLVVVLGWATVALPVLSPPAGADTLCLDRTNHFVPCSSPASATPTAGAVPTPPAGAASRAPGQPVIARRTSRPQNGWTAMWMILANACPFRGRGHAWRQTSHAPPTPRLEWGRGWRCHRVHVLSAGGVSTSAGQRPTQRIPHAKEGDGIVRRRRWLAASTQIVAGGSISEAPSVAEQDIVAPVTQAGDVAIDRVAAAGGVVRLLQLTIDSLTHLADKLDAVQADDSDLVVAIPDRAAVVVGHPEELVKAVQRVGGICVAASPAPLASPGLADQLKRAIAGAVEDPAMRCQCFPLALAGPAVQIRSLLADLPKGGSDADRLTAAILADRHEIILDNVSFFFHVLDGTGTDVTIVAGRAHVGGRQPLVLIDPAPDGHALVSAEFELADRGTGDLARLLRYDQAAASADEVTLAAPEVQVTPLWTPSFCATVIRAAEVAGMWANDDDASMARASVSLVDLFPRLLAHLAADLDRRVWPRLREWQPLDGVALSVAMVIRQQSGGRAASRRAGPGVESASSVPSG